MHTKPAKPQSSIIIPVYNNMPYTKACLESIFVNTDLQNIEIIIVDNASTDGTREYLSQLKSQCPISLVTNSMNLGFAKACNQGAIASKGKYLVFLNNDTEVTNGWLDALLSCKKTFPQSGALGSKLLYPDGSIQHAGVIFTENKRVGHIYTGLHKDHPAVNKIREFQAVTTACMFIKKTTFFKVGQFDEKFKNGFEDIDLCLSLRKTGYKNYYCPNSVVIHHESKTPGRHAHSDYNAKLLGKKWGKEVNPDEQYYYTEDSIKAWTVKDDDNQNCLLMKDTNSNPFLKKARLSRQNNKAAQAMNYYIEALKFNPYDIKNQLIAHEAEEFSRAIKSE